MKITNRVEGMALPKELQMVQNHRAQKQLHTPEPTPEVGPNQWIAESQDWGGMNSSNTRYLKRRRMIMEEREARFRAVA